MLEKLKLLLQVKQLDSFTDEVDLTPWYCCFVLGFLSCLFGCVEITYLISVFDLECERKILLSIFKDSFKVLMTTGSSILLTQLFLN